MLRPAPRCRATIIDRGRSAWACAVASPHIIASSMGRSICHHRSRYATHNVRCCSTHYPIYYGKCYAPTGCCMRRRSMGHIATHRHECDVVHCATSVSLDNYEDTWRRGVSHTPAMRCSVNHRDAMLCSVLQCVPMHSGAVPHRDRPLHHARSMSCVVRRCNHWSFIICSSAWKPGSWDWWRATADAWPLVAGAATLGAE